MYHTVFLCTTDMVDGNFRLHIHIKDWTPLVAVYVKQTKGIEFVLTVLSLKSKVLLLKTPS